LARSPRRCRPLFIAGLGIIVRGAAYALRSGAARASELRAIDTAAGVSSVLTPFALGAAVGGIASRRVPIGNAAGNLVSSWLNPTSLLIGVLAVATSAYLAAVFLAADAARREQDDLARYFRVRALGSGALAGVVALGGLAVLHGDAHPLYHGLLAGDGLPALLISILAGARALQLVYAQRFEAARYTAALAVAAIIAGWALAQQPILLPGLTIAQAAASHDVLVAVIVVVIGGAAILFPSLALLFRLTLAGDLDEQAPTAPSLPVPTTSMSSAAPGLLVRAAIACLIAGIGFLTIADARWAHAIGVVALLAFLTTGFLAVAPAGIARASGEE
jgi:cytochrome d ubiquinol oxidase subunit II